MAATGIIPDKHASLHGHEWADGQWMARRGERFSAASPVSIYEVHPGSWMRVPEENNRVLTYHEIAPKLADYARRMGYTHVLILDPAEDELMHLVNYLHQHQIGVLVAGGSAGTPRPTEANPTHSNPTEAKRWVEKFHLDGLCVSDRLEGAGAAYKLDRGFVQDIRSYLAHTPAERKAHHYRLTSWQAHAFQEDYILPLSHTDLAPLMCMPGDEWQRFANFRLLLAYMFLQPGKKLLFMGHDFGQWREWTADTSIDWHLTRLRYHQGVQQLVRRFNDVYFHERALHESDARAEAFEWIVRDDAQGGTISWLRWDAAFKEVFLVVFNFTPRVHRNFKIGVPRGGEWQEVINTDAQEYGGSGQGNFGGVQAAPFGWHGRPNSLVITVPPLAAVAFKSQQGD